MEKCQEGFLNVADESAYLSEEEPTRTVKGRISIMDLDVEYIRRSGWCMCICMWKSEFYFVPEILYILQSAHGSVYKVCMTEQCRVRIRGYGSQQQQDGESDLFTVY